MTPVRIRSGRALQFIWRVLGGWVALRAAILLPHSWWLNGGLTQGAQTQIVAAPQAGPAATAPVRAQARTRVADRPGGALLAPLVAGLLPIARAGALVAAAGPSADALRGGSGGGGIIGGTIGWDNGMADTLMRSSLSFTAPGGDQIGWLEKAAAQPGLGFGDDPFVRRFVAGEPDPDGSLARATRTAAAQALAPPIAQKARSMVDRWSLSGWMLARGGSSAAFGAGPMLGASQAGLRLDYHMTAGASLYGRFSRALGSMSAEEAAIGIALRPLAGVPVSLLAERRQRVGPGGRSGFALLAAGGIGPREIAPRVAVEGYAQGGIVGLPGVDGFADGKASLGYRLTADGAPQQLSLGGAVSGSIQPGAARVDLGPQLQLRLPAGGGAFSVAAEWRARVAGDASPDSGPAVTLVAQF